MSKEDRKETIEVSSDLKTFVTKFKSLHVKAESGSVKSREKAKKLLQEIEKLFHPFYVEKESTTKDN